LTIEVERFEKWNMELEEKYSGRCPKCKEQGITNVFALGDDSFFCENPHCLVIRHSNLGFYEFTGDDPNLPDVSKVFPSMINKRVD
jgi:hypothetical protein